MDYMPTLAVWRVTNPNFALPRFQAPARGSDQSDPVHDPSLGPGSVAVTKGLGLRAVESVRLRTHAVHFTNSLIKNSVNLILALPKN